MLHWCWSWFWCHQLFWLLKKKTPATASYITNNKIGVVWKPITHWGRVAPVCNSKLTIIGSDNDLSPGIIWTNVGIVLIAPSETYFSEILSEIYTFSFKKVHLKMSSGKCRPFYLGLSSLKLLLSSFFNTRTSTLTVYSLKWCNTNRNLSVPKYEQSNDCANEKKLKHMENKSHEFSKTWWNNNKLQQDHAYSVV